MALYKPSELRQFLDEIGAHPKKGLSQNFLIDGNIINKIITCADVRKGDVVLEIGPGPGALTEALLNAGAHVIAVEKDTVLAEALQRLGGDGHRLDVYCDDIMEFPIEEKLGQYGKVKVIANLPYHLTTPILTTLLPLREVFSSVTVMVQEEVAKRFTAKPGNKIYGSITVFLNYHSTPQYNFIVSRKCFYPAPKVQSAVVTFMLQTPPPVKDEKEFFKLTRTCFEQRRKMIRSSLSKLYDTENVSIALEKIGCNPQARPEMLSLEQFIQLYHNLTLF